MTSISTVEKERKKERSVLQYSNTVQDKMRKLVTVSIPQEKLDVLRKFRKIAQREAGPKGFSCTAVKAWAEYIQRHEEGNPQLKITTYMDASAPSPVRVLCRFLSGAASEGRVHCTRLGGWVQGVKCYPCKHNQLRKKEP